MHRCAILSVIAVVLLGTFNSAQAVLISGDFIRTAGGVTTSPVSGDTAPTGTVKNADGLIFTGQVGAWNALNVGPQGNQSRASFTSAPLLDGNGNVTTAVFSILPTNLPSPQQFGYRAAPAL
jgi:hypothetical protein